MASRLFDFLVFRFIQLSKTRHCKKKWLLLSNVFYLFLMSVWCLVQRTFVISKFHAEILWGFVKTSVFQLNSHYHPSLLRSNLKQPQHIKSGSLAHYSLNQTFFLFIYINSLKTKNHTSLTFFLFRFVLGAFYSFASTNAILLPPSAHLVP